MSRLECINQFYKKVYICTHLTSRCSLPDSCIPATDYLLRIIFSPRFKWGRFLVDKSRIKRKILRWIRKTKMRRRKIKKRKKFKRPLMEIKGTLKMIKTPGLRHNRMNQSLNWVPRILRLFKNWLRNRMLKLRNMKQKLKTYMINWRKQSKNLFTKSQKMITPLSDTGSKLMMERHLQSPNLPRTF